MRVAALLSGKLNKPLAVSIGPDWWSRSMPGSGCLSNDKRFRSINLQAASSLLITAGDSLVQSALNLSWLIYGSAHPGHISNAGPGSAMQHLTAGWADLRSPARIVAAATETWTCHVGSAQLSSDHSGVEGDVILGRAGEEMRGITTAANSFSLFWLLKTILPDPQSVNVMKSKSLLSILGKETNLGYQRRLWENWSLWGCLAEQNWKIIPRP